jgi:limonene-1,2-epoxide hydrolase
MSEPTQVVERFLTLLAEGEIDAAVDLLATDIVYSNVSLPTVRGRERVRRLAHLTLGRDGAGFEVYNHAISAAGSSVLTERTDVMKMGRLRIQFWVCGRFDVEDGKIVLWRDRFDWMNYTAATLRGLVGIVVPALRAKAPRS